MQPTNDYTGIIHHAYEAFNKREVDKVLSYMNSDVHWSNGWEGGYVIGHDAVKDYWTRQWKELDTIVVPVSTDQRNEHEMEVTVHQVVKDMQGNLLFDGIVKHVYIFKDGKIQSMEIENKS